MSGVGSEEEVLHVDAGADERRACHPAARAIPGERAAVDPPAAPPDLTSMYCWVCETIFRASADSPPTLSA